MKTLHQMIANQSIGFLLSRNIVGSASIYPWNINSLSTQPGGVVHAEGWALPMDGLSNNTSVYCNNVAPFSIIWSDNDIVANSFSMWPNSRSSGFAATWHLSSYYNDESLIFDVRDGDARMLPPQHRIYFPIASIDRYKVPNQIVMESIGATSPHLYIQAGYTLAQSFNRVLTTATGHQFSDYRQILDWGCGSARVSQHVLNMLGTTSRLYGIDVDARAIEWCNKNVPGLTSSVCELNPPTSFEDDSFDVIYAYSVLTHLREQDANAWLDEIRRILRPGGFFMFTTLGSSSLTWLFPQGNSNISSKLIREGIFDEAKNDNIDAVISDQSYYRNTWVTDDYVKSVWGKDFLYCYNENSFHFYQDIHLFRKQ